MHTKSFNYIFLSFRQLTKRPESTRTHHSGVNELGWERVDDVVRANDLAVVRRLLSSDSPPDTLRGRLLLHIPMRRSAEHARLRVGSCSYPK